MKNLILGSGLTLIMLTGAVAAQAGPADEASKAGTPQDIIVSAAGPSGGEDRLTENVSVMGRKGGGGKVHSQDISAATAPRNGGEDRLTENVSVMGSGGGAGKVNVQDIGAMRKAGTSQMEYMKAEDSKVEDSKAPAGHLKLGDIEAD